MKTFTRLLLIILILVFTFKLEAQVIIKQGVYQGIIENTLSPFFYIKSDSTFLFIDIEKENLKHFGFGEWTFTRDSIFKFKFVDKILPVLQDIKLDYKTESIAPFDSIFIFGQIRSLDNKALDFASVIINNKLSILTDKNGNFYFSCPRKIIPYEVTIIKKINDYEIVSIPLNQSTNKHEVNVKIPTITTASTYLAFNSNPLLQPLFYKDEFELTLTTKSIKFNRHNSIFFFNDKKNVLIKNLEAAKKNQPFLISNINFIINYLNK